MEGEAVVRLVLWDPLKQLVLVLVKDKEAEEKEELDSWTGVLRTDTVVRVAARCTGL